MKLLVICQYFYPEQFRVSDVCFHLAKLGHEVTVLTGLPNYPMGEIFKGYEWDQISSNNQLIGQMDLSNQIYTEHLQGVTVHRINLTPRSKGKKALAKNYLSFVRKASQGVDKLYASSDFDRLVVFQYSPVTMALPAIKIKKLLSNKHRKEIPLFLYCFDLWPESIVSAGLKNHGLIYGMIKQLSRYIYRRTDQIFVSSENFKKYFYQKFGISENLSYLPIYAEELFSSCSNASKSIPFEGDPNTDIHLVFAGNIGEMQSIDTIIKAAAEIKKFRENGAEKYFVNEQIPPIIIHIVGDGTALNKSKNLAGELGLTDRHILFHGRHPLEEMPSFYTMATALIVTLKRDPFISYTLPGKVQSYMAFGKPILAAIDGETTDVIAKSQCGLSCGAEDYKGFAEVILTFAREREKHQEYGANGRAYYEKHFSKEAFFQRLIELCQLY